MSAAHPSRRSRKRTESEARAGGPPHRPSGRTKEMAPQSRLSKLLSYLSSCCRYDNVRYFASRESRSAVGLCTGYAGDLQHGTSSLSAALITRRPQTPPRVARQGTPSRSAIQTRYTRCTRERGWSEFPSRGAEPSAETESATHEHLVSLTPSQHQRRRDGLHSRANMRILRGFSPRRHSRPRARARARAGVQRFSGPACALAGSLRKGSKIIGSCPRVSET